MHEAAHGQQYNQLYFLHLSDDAVELLKTGKFNHRLLSEMLCHKDFRRMMLDAEIDVDIIADMRINRYKRLPKNSLASQN